MKESAVFEEFSVFYSTYSSLFLFIMTPVGSYKGKVVPLNLSSRPESHQIFSYGHYFNVSIVYRQHWLYRLLYKKWCMLNVFIVIKCIIRIRTYCLCQAIITSASPIIMTLNFTGIQVTACMFIWLIVRSA